MPYVRRTWQNAPSSATPLNAAALNNIEDGVEAAVEAVTGRLSEATLESTIGSVVAQLDITGKTAAEITAFLVGGGQKRIVGSATITEAIVIPSGTTLDARGAHIYAAGNAHPLIKNTQAVTTVGTPTTGAGTHDTDITIVGGKWESGAGGGAMHRIFMHQVDRLKISDVEVVSAEGKYAILLADVRYFSVERAVFDTNSDGVHITGPALHGYVADITGETHDDSVALGASDYDTYDYSRGNIVDVTVERVATDTPARKVLLFTSGHVGVTESLKIQDVRVRDISGTNTQPCVMISVGSGDPAQTALVDNIAIENVTALTGASRGAVELLASSLNNNRIRNVRVRGVTLKQQDNPGATASRYAVRCSNVVVETLSVSDVFLDDGGLGAAVGVKLETAGSIGTLRVERARQTGSIATSGLVQIGGTFTVTSAYLEAKTDRRIITTDTATATFGSIFVGGETSYTGSHIAVVASPAIVCRDVQVSAGTFLAPSTSAVAPTLSGRLRHLGGTPVSQSGVDPKKVIGRSLEIECDIRQLSKTTGSTAYNTATLSCGTGPVYFDGTNWVNVLSGATYTPA